MAPTWTPDSLPDLSGRTYVVTGGNTGIGKWTVHHLARRNARVFLGSRSAEKGQKAISEIQASVPHAKVELLIMDLMDLSSVVAAAKEVANKSSTLHGLVNSAGIMATPFFMTKDGYESQFETNYLSHWVLTWHLLPLLQRTARTSPPGNVRIVNVSSMGHAAAPSEGIKFQDTSLKHAFTFRRYGQSKLANILHTKALERRYGPNGGTAERSTAIWNVSLHPGNVDTQLNRKAKGSSFTPVLRYLGVFMTPEEGSYTSLFAVAGTELKDQDSGSYHIPFGKKKTPSKMAQDVDLAEKLWNWTEKEMRSKGFI